MVFWIANDRDAAANLSNDVTLGNRFGRVVGAFRMHVRSDRPYEFLDRWFIKDRYEIDTSKSGDQFSPFDFGNEWTPLAFQSACLSVGVDPDNEYVAESFRTLKISYVAYVQEIEASVG